MYQLNMRSHESSGFLITFCGLDGCGKTTIIRKILNELEQDYPLVLTKQPTNAVRNSEIFRAFMDSPKHDEYDYRSLSLLAASDRLQHVHQVIMPELKSGKIVLSDRYFYSCLANLHARGYKEDRWIHEIAQSVVAPDIAFFLDVPVDTAISRVRSRPIEKDRFIDIDLQYRLREEYIKICEKNGGYLLSTIVSQEETFREALHIIKQRVGEK